MEASTSNGSDDVKTFRGRSLEEVLPQIRAELGPDAIVLRRREGLGGGVGGFFQRPYVEVDARPAQTDEKPLEIRSDRATAEGLSSPAVQALFEQATPFADALAAAARQAETTEFSAGLYGPQPNAEAIAAAAPAEPPAAPEGPANGGIEEEDEPAPDIGGVDTSRYTKRSDADDELPAEPASLPSRPFAEPAADAPGPTASVPSPPFAELAAPSHPRAGERPPSADAAEQRLVAAGLSPALAADVVGEAVAHGLPFSAPRNMKRLVRAALARRIPVLSALGPEPRVLAFVGGGGAGKSSAVAHLALAYAQAGADVAVISLRGNGSLAARLEPRGIAVIAADDAETARRRVGQRSPLITLIDTPAAGPSHPAAHVKALADDLKALHAAEVHLALPATLSASAAREVASALAAVGPTHVALTHTDETARPGAPLELALAAARPLSYVCAREGAQPADPATLAQQLLP
jgi:flagellar biosynthesis protein FlhF